VNSYSFEYSLKASIISLTNGRFKKFVAIRVMVGLTGYIYLIVYKIYDKMCPATITN